MFASRMINTFKSPVVKQHIHNHCSVTTLTSQSKSTSRVALPTQYPLQNKINQMTVARKFSVFHQQHNPPHHALTLQNDKTKHRYYAVGALIEDLWGGLLIGVRPRKPSQNMLEESLLLNQTTLKLFVLYDHAKEYASSVRDNAHAYSFYPKTPLNGSKVCPIFTLDLVIDLQQHHLHTIVVDRKERYFDDKCHLVDRDKDITLNYYEVDTSEVKKEHIIRAEFYGSRIASIEFKHPKASTQSLTK
jgi:hypothetical protein